MTKSIEANNAKSKAKKVYTPDQLEYRKQIIKKMFTIYFIQTSSYLIMHKNGTYGTYTKGKKFKNGNAIKSLADWQLENHLDGLHTVGAKAGTFMNIFLAFDVDFPDIKVAKWITLKISDVLDTMNIEHHISFSGSKGYHCEIYFENVVAHDIHKNLFNYVLDQADVRQYFKNEKKGISTKTLDDGSVIELGDVEHRPSEGYGIKLPLGYHQKTKKFCGFCDKSNGLRVMTPAESYEYFLNIRRIDSKILIEEHFPELLTYTKIEQFVPDKAFIKAEKAIAQYTPPKYNMNEEEAIEEATDLLFNGLKYKNSRHNTIFKIAKLFKFNGMEEENATETLLEWMDHQPKEMYESTLEFARDDIIKTVHDVYEGGYSIKPPEKEIAVTYQEIVAIINSCPRETEKLLMYAILIHSKRYATKSGVFYFPQDKMAEVTGLGITTVKVTLPKLEKLGVLEYVKHKQKFDWVTMKRPKNEYRVLLKIDPEIVESKIYITEKQDDFNRCLLNFFTIDELKKKKFPRRHMDKLKEMTI